MSQVHRRDTWAAGEAYEPYVGRWSRLVARRFLEWLAVPPGREWLDVGAGTGALSQVVLELASPSAVVGVDPSGGYLDYARQHTADPRARFEVASADAIPFDARSFDASVSGLVLNFVPSPDAAVMEMKRVTRPGGTVAAYVWDYASKMELMRHFWDAAVALNAEARDLDEGVRFPICNPDRLAALFGQAGLASTRTRAIDVPTVFRDFDDYWSPFLGGQAPAPGYAMSLPEDRRAALRDYVRAHLPLAPDGSIHLVARAWAVAGTV